MGLSESLVFWEIGFYEKNKFLAPHWIFLRVLSRFALGNFIFEKPFSLLHAPFDVHCGGNQKEGKEDHVKISLLWCGGRWDLIKKTCDLNQRFQ